MLHLPVPALLPEAIAIQRVYKLNADPQLLANFAYASFDNRRNLELRANLPDALGLGFEFKSGGARNHPQVVKAGESMNQVFGQTIAEILGIRFRTEADDGQHGQRTRRRDPVCLPLHDLETGAVW